MNDPAPMPGPVLPIGDSFLKIGVCADNIVRVAYAMPVTLRRRRRGGAQRAHRAASTKPDNVRKLACICSSTSTLRFNAASISDPWRRWWRNGMPVYPLTVTAVVGLPNNRSTASASIDIDLIDISDVDLGLYQHNTEIFIPFLVSSRGYGILWDNTSFTRYGELADAVPLPNTAGLYSTSPDAEAGDVAMPGKARPSTGPARYAAPVSGTISS